MASHATERPARRIRLAAARTLTAHADFSAFPSSPMRLKLSASFFNQRQKFFVPGRAEQRRFNHTPPRKTSFPGDKFL